MWNEGPGGGEMAGERERDSDREWREVIEREENVKWGRRRKAHVLTVSFHFIDGYSVGKMEHEKSLCGQSKFSNIDRLSVGKTKIQISD